MNFEQFQLTREAVEDARTLPYICEYYEDERQAVPIFLYVGGYYIERLNDDGLLYGLPIENTYQTYATLEDAERALWDYAESELNARNP